MFPQKHNAIIYQTETGRYPFEDWIRNLMDIQGRAKIRARVDRLEQGNFGKHDFVGQGVSELKIDFGPGYRVYYGRVNPTTVMILCGGNKKTQRKDIRKAIEYWDDYRRSKK